MVDEQALLPGGMLGLSVDAKPLQPTDSQVLGGEGVGATQGKLQVLNQSEPEQVAQCGWLCEPDGQVAMIAGWLHGKRRDRLTAAHQVGQAVVTVPDVYRAAAVLNGISLCKNQRTALVAFCEVAKCRDTQCSEQKKTEAGGRCHSCPARTEVLLRLLPEPAHWKAPEREPEAYKCTCCLKVAPKPAALRDRQGFYLGTSRETAARLLNSAQLRHKAPANMLTAN